jgi:hypothetical protein
LDVSEAANDYQAAMLVAVAAACDIRRGSGLHIEAEWNGTPMNGYPGDTTELVRTRWHYERLLFQLKNGIITIADLP